MYDLNVGGHPDVWPTADCGYRAATAATEPLMLLGGVSYHRFGTWLMVLGLYDLIFALLGYAVFDFLLED